MSKSVHRHTAKHTAAGEPLNKTPRETKIETQIFLLIFRTPWTIALHFWYPVFRPHSNGDGVVVVETPAPEINEYLEDSKIRDETKRCPRQALVLVN